MDKKTVLAGIVCAAIGFVAGYSIKNNTPQKDVNNPVLEKTVEEQHYKISRVVDGDTVELDTGIEVRIKRVRLLGINTPERGEHLYKEAKDALDSLVMNKQIIVEKEHNELDKYGRALGYISVDGKIANIELVRLGYAKAFMHKGLKYEKQIL